MWVFLRRRRRRLQHSEKQETDLLTEPNPYRLAPLNTNLGSSQPWASDPTSMSGGMLVSTSGNGSVTAYAPQSVNPSNSVGQSTSYYGSPTSNGSPTYGSDDHRMDTSRIDSASAYGMNGYPRIASSSHPPPVPSSENSRTGYGGGGNPPMRKGQRPPLPQTQFSNLSSEHYTPVELAASRMIVPNRPQDFGPVPVPDADVEDDAQALPPDYHQATEPMPARR